MTSLQHELQRHLRHYGLQNQIIKLAEESAELSAEALRSRVVLNRASLAGEIADVLNMIDQIVPALDLSGEVAIARQVKAARQSYRIASLSRQEGRRTTKEGEDGSRVIQTICEAEKASNEISRFMDGWLRWKKVEG